MPSSASETIPYLLEFTRKNRPTLKSVLDVGIGFGKDGFLLREYFDVKEWHRYKPKDWQLQITGVDIFEGYLSELQKIIYNKIIIGDIIKVLPGLGKFDLAILSDVIEHLKKEDGLRLIHDLFDHVEDIVITTPLGFLEQSAPGVNPHEEHKSGWTPEDFMMFEVVDKAVISRIRKPEKLLTVYIRKAKRGIAQ